MVRVVLRSIILILTLFTARLQSAAQKAQMAPAELRTLSILIFIISLLVEHCNFDRLRTEHSGMRSSVNEYRSAWCLIGSRSLGRPGHGFQSKISRRVAAAPLKKFQGSIIEHVYHSLLNLYQKQSEPGLRGRTLQCLGMIHSRFSFHFLSPNISGFLFRTQPTLMTLESSAMIMDATFASQEEEGRARLLKIMQEFLMSEAAKHTQKEKSKAGTKSKPAPTDVDMEELVGNTDGFADSG